MKFIFSFLFGILILSPTFASYECTDNTQKDQCKCAGWGWVDLDENSGFCEQCGQTQYSPANDSVCHDCIDYTGNWAADAQDVSNSIFDTDHATSGQSSCPWVCANNYFDDVAHTECFACPLPSSGFMSYRANANISHISTCNSCNQNQYIIQRDVIINNEPKNVYYCGTCGLNIQPTATDTNIYTCNCPETTNHNTNTFTTNYNECVCPESASWSNTSNRCKCSANKYLSPGTDGVYSCKTCPSNGNCPEGSTWESATCATGYKKVPNTTDHTFTCESCSDSNATLYGNVCKCNAGYYGTQNGLDTECTQCPIGTTTTIGATQRSDCKMNHNTKFCYGSGDNKKCMHLIPAGTVISVSNNT